jgi:integrase
MIYKRGCDKKGPDATCSKCSRRGSCGVYWYKFMWAGKLLRESTKQGNDKVARQMEAAHRTSLAKGEVGIRERKPLPTLSEFCSNRVEPWAKVRPSWLWYRSGIRPLLAYRTISGMKLDGITSENVADYARHRQSAGLEVGTINRELRVLRRCLRLAVEWGLLERTPKVQMLRGEKRRERVVSEAELQGYLACATQLLAHVATMLYDTGLRPDECHRLRWESVSWINGRNGNLLVTEGKTAAARRSLPMTPRVRALLQTRWEAADRPLEGFIWAATTKSGHIDHSTLKKQHVRALKLSGVRPFLLYSLRHSFATRLAPHVDAWTLCKVMGWASLSVAMRYIHPSDEQVLEAISVLGGHNSGHNENREDLRLNPKPLEEIENNYKRMVSAAGFEPATHALKGHCSTN